MTMKKVFSVMFAILILVLSSSLVACSSGPSEEERQAEKQAEKEMRKTEFEAWYAEKQPAEAEERAKFKSFLEDSFLDGKHTSVGVMVKITGLDIEKEILETARPILLEVTLEQPLEQTLKDFGVESPSELPGYIGVFADGTTHIPSSALGFNPAPNLGYLGREHVRADSIHYEQVCNSIPQEKGDNFLVTFTLFANRGVEDDWKKEVLFEGTARELCSQNGDSYPKYDAFRQMLVFKRPAQKSLPVPDAQDILLVQADDLVAGKELYFPRLQTGLGLKFGTRLFEGITDLQASDAKIIEFHGGLNPELDIGSPVYAVFADIENPLRLIGFIGRYGPVAISADVALADFFEEFPHVIVRSEDNQ